MPTKFVAMILKKPNFSGGLEISAAHAMYPDSYESFALMAQNYDEVFDLMNRDERPKGYTGRSLSIGDMIYNDSTGDIVMVTANGFTDIETGKAY